MSSSQQSYINSPAYRHVPNMRNPDDPRLSESGAQAFSMAMNQQPLKMQTVGLGPTHSSAFYWQSGSDEATPQLDLTADIDTFLHSRQRRDEPYHAPPTNGLRPQLPNHAWQSRHYSGTRTVSDSGALAIPPPDLEDRSTASFSDSAYQSLKSPGGLSNTRGQSSGPHQNGKVRFSNDLTQFQELSAPVAPPHSVASDPTGQSSRSAPQKTGAKAPRRRNLVPPCGTCGKRSRNHSEANKHVFQHTKPYKCDQRACTRGEGFATTNDLDRHRMTVHRLPPSVGRKTGYICAACPQPTNGTDPKYWPRRDNFKAHIKRKHPGMNEQRVLASSESQRPADAMSMAESGYASAPPSQADAVDAGFHDVVNDPMLAGPSGRTSQQGDYTLFSDLGSFDQDSELAGVGSGPLADSSGGNRIPCPGFDDSAWDDRPEYALSILSDAAASVGMGPLSPGYPRTRSTSMDGFADLPKFRITPYSDDVEPQPSYDPGLAPWTGRPSEKHIGAGESSPSGCDFVCRYCGKQKKRECDLRKHTKRHTRPYGCTFPDCSKRFGSRNDWKRHETSQHFLADTWRCGLRSPTGEICGQLFFHQQAFHAHLQGRPHRLASRPAVAAAAARMHLGRDGNRNFWCGFCPGPVPQPNAAEGAWEFRLRHIGDHFDKDPADIGDWVCVRWNKRKADITRAERDAHRDDSRVGGWDGGSERGAEDGGSCDSPLGGALDVIASGSAYPWQGKQRLDAVDDALPADDGDESVWAPHAAEMDWTA